MTPETKDEILVALGAETCWMPGCKNRATKSVMFTDGLIDKRCETHADLGRAGQRATIFTVRDL